MSVASGERCESIGNVSLPIAIEGKVVLIDVVVVPGLPHFLILGINF